MVTQGWSVSKKGRLYRTEWKKPYKSMEKKRQERRMRKAKEDEAEELDYNTVDENEESSEGEHIRASQQTSWGDRRDPTAGREEEEGDQEAAGRTTASPKHPEVTASLLSPAPQTLALTDLVSGTRGAPDFTEQQSFDDDNTSQLSGMGSTVVEDEMKAVEAQTERRGLSEQYLSASQFLRAQREGEPLTDEDGDDERQVDRGTLREAAQHNPHSREDTVPVMRSLLKEAKKKELKQQTALERSNSEAEKYRRLFMESRQEATAKAAEYEALRRQVREGDGK